MPDGLVEPGEAVTLSIGLQNTGTVNTSQSLIATLQASGGVTSPSGAQDYGRLTAGGPATFRNFSFTAASQSLGSNITLTLQLSDGGTNRGTVTINIALGLLALKTDPGGCTVGFNVPRSPTTCRLTHCASTRRPPYPPGTYTIICDTDAPSRFTFLLRVDDGEAPTISCPANLTRGTDANRCNATITLTNPTATDNCGVASITGERSDEQTLTAPFPKGVTTIRWRAVDGGGREAVCQQTVTVTDTQAPVLACPSDITATAYSSNSVAVIYPALTASDACQAVAPTCTPPSGSSFPVGVTNVNCSASDAAGNAATCSFKVTVNQEFGQPLPPGVASSDSRAGSVLAFPLFTSNPTSPQSQNTRISLTNTDAARQAFVHLFFVADTCSVADGFVCLTAQQTMTFLASDVDPGVTGYLLAVAVNANGCPINFNALIGDAYVKFASGHAGNLAAEAFSAVAAQPVVCAAGATSAELRFDGVSYSQTARVIGLDNVPSRLDGNDTKLIINRLGGDLRTGASTLNTLLGLLYDDAENVTTLSTTAGCQLQRSFPFCSAPQQCATANNFIPAGRSGWLTFYSLSDVALFGAVLNYNPNTKASSSAFNQGRNLHKLSLSGGGSLTIPILPPQC